MAVPPSPSAVPAPIRAPAADPVGLTRDNAGVDRGEAGAIGRWLVLVPVKASAVGKSRIALSPARRARLARAMAIDTVTAIAAASRVRAVLVLVDDDGDGRALAAIGKVTAHRCRARGLNEAIREALRLPEASGGPVAVLPADLPSLRAQELDVALDAADGLPLSVVADRQGTGTTLLAAGRAALLEPRYGTGSFARHVAVGAVPLAVPVGSGLRRDVDVVTDLRDATGPLTCAEAGDLGTDTATG